MILEVVPDFSFINQLPDAPGVYRFFGVDGTLLYVGKAISLIKRVRSYFRRDNSISPRISLMVSKIAKIEITVTENEASALILENNLIKNAHPKYNIVFRDDKSYPYIRVSHHQFPLIEYTRRKPDKLADYFGPYPNSFAVKETLELLQRLFKLRTCADAVFANRSRPCMLYQIERCSAPCVDKISKDEYSNLIKNATAFLSGNYSDLIDRMSSDMYAAAELLRFEEASSLRDKIAAIKQVQDKQIITSSSEVVNGDLVTYIEQNGMVFIYLIMLRNGVYIGDKHFEIKIVDEVNMQEAFVEEYYTSRQDVAKIYCDFPIDVAFAKFMFEARKIKLQEAKTNKRIVELFKMAQTNLQIIVDNYKKGTVYDGGAARLSEFLNLKVNRVECYDTSHHHGSSAVTSMVVYEDGIINNNLYRKFNLPLTINGDDLLALSTVLNRRLMNKTLPLPEVILVDGGKTQLEETKNILEELGFHDKIKAIAIYKGENRKPELDRVIIDTNLELNYHDEPQLFKLLQALRDEAHRFAITGHRKQQVNKMKHSRLEDIPGIGAQKRKALIAFFGSSQLVAAATVEELCQIKGIGPELANQIYSYFH
jgi:excinuclease ABC subunit C